MSDLATIPPTVEQSPVEDLTWPDDLTPLLNGGTPTNLTSILTDLGFRRRVIILPDMPTILGNTAIQRIRPGVLTEGHTYRLVFVFTPSGTTNLLNSVLTITCTY